MGGLLIQFAKIAGSYLEKNVSVAHKDNKTRYTTHDKSWENPSSLLHMSLC